MSQPEPIVAIAGEFLEAFSRVPRAQQKKVREFTEKFRLNPMAAAINYEKIHHVRDPKVRTVRIGADYRAIVIHPDEGNVYLLVWVDHHDEAMEWARNRVFEINPMTGALQVVSISAVEAAQPQPAAAAPEKKPPAGLFAATSDDDLLNLAVPKLLLPAVRAIHSGQELNELSPHLPAEAAEALMWLAEGLPLDEIRCAIERSKPNKVDTADFAQALEHPDSRRRFVTVETHDDLVAMLKAPLAKWRVFLHPSQERLVRRNFAGPSKVVGGAGTGKTVVAMHRVRHLVQAVFTAATDQVLLTTFTANLAADIEENMKVLGGADLDRVEVVHLHAWAARLLRRHGMANLNVLESGSDQHREMWNGAVSVTGASKWDRSFYEAEWRDVVQAQGITTRDEYLKASRRGRGRSITRADRAEIWKVFEEYQSSLRKAGQVEWLDVIRGARRLLETQGTGLPYRAVVVDEAQDLHPEEWRLIRALVPEGPNDLFIVGDAHQRIYGKPVALGTVSINVRGRSYRLRINYRTTREIKDWALGLLQPGQYDDLDGAREELRGYVSLLTGNAPTVQKFSSFQEECEYIAKAIKEALADRRPGEVCVVARFNSLVDKYMKGIAEHGVSGIKLSRDNPPATDSSVHFATMHRVKGLEYPVVFIAGAEAMPTSFSQDLDDQVAVREHENRERSLLFVSATRAREVLVVTAGNSNGCSFF